MKYIRFIFLLFWFFRVFPTNAQTGYDLWQTYRPVIDNNSLSNYKKNIRQIVFFGESQTDNVAKEELLRGLNAMIGTSVPVVSSISNFSIVVGSPANSSLIASSGLENRLSNLGNEGYLIVSQIINRNKCILIVANTDKGILYGVFHFLRLIQTNSHIENLNIIEKPLIQYRLLNHWDNLDRFVERGYSGISIWDWQRLPGYLSERYTDYARANASVGINGSVLNNVNANAIILTPVYLQKVAAIANVLRPYGIKVYLTARFNAPMQIDTFKTADPLDMNVQKWWREKVKEIYSYIPDFGGFLVKANSEGQPGPQNFGRTHADGANMLADALEPFGGIVMWRAFVYNSNAQDDRAKQAYNEFVPLDGKFHKNVIIQVKNGPIDFQPREPFHPLFGALQHTSVMPELQITQEYLGQATQLVFLAPLYKECLESDTYAKGPGSTVARVIDGELFKNQITAIAGVANIGNEPNWCGHPFAQANWYAFGRLAWNYHISSKDIAEEWLRMTYSNDTGFLNPVCNMMLTSREAAVNYMTPLGLHHIMGYNHHYGPAPWFSKGRADWTCVYYHRADSIGLGFDRSTTGSNAVSQYYQPVMQKFNDLNSCPDSFLLWFHHVPWDYKMKSGRTMWNELCFKYYLGVDQVAQFQNTWEKCKPFVTGRQFEPVKQLLEVQHNEACFWRDACVLYFQTFSKRPLPDGFEKPKLTLDEIMKIEFKYVPGINN